MTTILQELPDETLFEVCSFLPGSDLCRMSQVCHRLRWLICDRRVLILPSSSGSNQPSGSEDPDVIDSNTVFFKFLPFAQDHSQIAEFIEEGDHWVRDTRLWRLALLHELKLMVDDWREWNLEKTVVHSKREKPAGIMTNSIIKYLVKLPARERRKMKERLLSGDKPVPLLDPRISLEQFTREDFYAVYMSHCQGKIGIWIEDRVREAKDAVERSEGSILPWSQFLQELCQRQATLALAKKRKMGDECLRSWVSQMTRKGNIVVDDPDFVWQTVHDMIVELGASLTAKYGYSEPLLTTLVRFCTAENVQSVLRILQGLVELDKDRFLKMLHEDCVDFRGWLPINSAASNSDGTAAAILVRWMSQWVDVTSDGTAPTAKIPLVSPLQAAMESGMHHGRFEIVKVLLELGADPTCRFVTRYGERIGENIKTPTQYAIERLDSDVLQLLVDHVPKQNSPPQDLNENLLKSAVDRLIADHGSLGFLVHCISVQEHLFRHEHTIYGLEISSAKNHLHRLFGSGRQLIKTTLLAFSIVRLERKVRREKHIHGDEEGLPEPLLMQRDCAGWTPMRYWVEQWWNELQVGIFDVPLQEKQWIALLQALAGAHDNVDMCALMDNNNDCIPHDILRALLHNTVNPQAPHIATLFCNDCVQFLHDKKQSSDPDHKTELQKFLDAVIV